MAIKKMFALFFCFVFIFFSVITAYAADDSLPFELRDDQLLVFSYVVTEPSDYVMVSESDLLVEGGDYSLFVYIDGYFLSEFHASCFRYVDEYEPDIFMLIISFDNSITVISSPALGGTGIQAPSLDSGVAFDLYIVQNNVYIPDDVSAGLSVVLDWVGIVLGSFLTPSGVLFPLFILLLVGISISLLFFVIKVFRIFFWGF